MRQSPPGLAVSAASAKFERRKVAEDQSLPDFDDVKAASGRLLGQAVRTPVIEAPLLNEKARGRVLIKPECLQRTGSFKFRGGWNCISQLDKSEWPGGVVAYSSGNHAQGVAAAAQICGLPAVIVMPADTPQIKKDNTRRLGAEIVEYDRASQAREEIAAKLAGERKAALVPPFDHPDIIAGQGTAVMELIEELAARGDRLDQLIVPAGGGGLLAGSMLSAKALSPETQVYCAEPAGFDDHARSLATGARQINNKATGSICDALLSPQPGQLTFAINGPVLAGGLVVSDDEVRAAMRFAFSHLKLVVEPGGSVALAAILSGKIDTQDKSTGIILSGGNVDPGLFGETLIAA
ncbi:MAG: threonine/serine dehydratase [Rhizobiales bacterium]|nr:threonine/serine dehydratase [Hyphomicrobiales bacterium]